MHGVLDGLSCSTSGSMASFAVSSRGRRKQAKPQRKNGECWAPSLRTTVKGWGLWEGEWGWHLSVQRARGARPSQLEARPDNVAAQSVAFPGPGLGSSPKLNASHTLRKSTLVPQCSANTISFLE